MIRFFARHPTAGNLLMLVFLAVGLISLPSIQRETFPDFAETRLQVRVVYPGASAEDVEESICTRIEDALDGVDGIDEVLAEARENLASITVTMDSHNNEVTFVSDVTAAINGIDDFPDEAEDALISRLGVTDPVISIAVTGPTDPAALKAYCEGLKDELTRLPDGPQVALIGFADHQIRIEARSTALEELGLSVRDLAGIISRQSLSLPLGTLETHDREILIRLEEERRRPMQFLDLVVVGGASGGEVLLGDIASVVDTFDPEEEKILFDGKRAGLLEIRKSKSQDSLDVLAAVRARMSELREVAPPGVEFKFTKDLTSVIRDRLDMLTRNGLQGLALVLLAMWLFFGIRFSFWVAMGLPVAFLGALALIPVLGLTINMLTMVALLLSLGLLMDDAMVIAENVAAHIHRGESALEAALAGTREVRNGVLSSFITTVCVLGPLAFLEGAIGRVLYVVPIVLGLVLTVSLVEAFLILPGHLAHALRHYDPDRKGWVQTRVDRATAWVRDRLLGPLVDFSVSWRYASLGLTLAAFLASVGMLVGGHLKFQSFPSVDGDVIECRVLLPQGTPLAQTEAAVTRLMAALDRVEAELGPNQPEGQKLVQAVSVRFNLNTDAKETGPHVATIGVDLLSAEVRRGRLDEVLHRWRTYVGQVPGVIDIKFGEPSFGPAGRPIEIRVQGEDLTQLASAADECIDWLGRMDGVVDLSHDLRPGKPEVVLRLRPGALALGVDAGELAQQVRSAFHGVTASTMQVGSESYDVDVRLAGQDKNSLGDLEAFRVTLQSGVQVPLDAVATLDRDRGFARIAHIDGLRTVTVEGDVDTERTNTAAVLGLFQKTRLPEIEQAHPGVSISLEGEMAESSETGRSMLRGLLIGLLGVFITLSYQFRSYLEPIVVMLAIPFAFIGVIWGHVLLGYPLTMPSMLGFISLAGVVVNDSILLVEFIKIGRRRGLSTHAAACEASRARFRAVSLTSITTMLGLLPLMAETSLQAQILIPLAISIVFGIAASTGLVLLLTPASYSILGDLGLVEDVERLDDQPEPGPGP